MVRSVRLDLFAEDHAHEAFAGALVRRLADEEGVAVDVQTRSARGGHGRVLTELRAYVHVTDSSPDVLVVALDANCKGYTSAANEVRQVLQRAAFAHVVLGIADPHVERWYMADAAALREALGASVTPGRAKCGRGVYKQQLCAALKRAGHIVVLGGAEFAPDIVAHIDWYRAAKADPNLGRFVDALRGALRRAAGP